MHQRAPNPDIVDLNWNRVLGWLLVLIIVPGGSYATSKIIGTLNSLSKTFVAQQIELAKLEGRMEAIEKQFGSYKNDSRFTRGEDKQELKDLKSEVSKMSTQVQRLVVVVESAHGRR